MSLERITLSARNRLFMAGAFLVALLILSNVFGYANPIDFCFIDIDSGWSGTGQTRQAILALRADDKEAYKLLCRNIDTITEASCLLDASQYANDVYGCFARGSHIIQLPDVQKASVVTLNGRAEALNELAHEADAYWNGR